VMRGLRGGGHLCDDAMVARVHDGGCHLRDAEGDSLSLGCHHHDLLTHLQWNEETGAQGGNLDAVFEAKQTGDHELGAVADGVDGAVLGDHALVPDQETLQRHDDAAKVRLVLGVVVQVLRVHDIVHGDQVGLRVGVRMHGRNSVQSHRGHRSGRGGALACVLRRQAAAPGAHTWFARRFRPHS